MVDYVAAPRRPRSVEAGDDYLQETRETLQVMRDDLAQAIASSGWVLMAFDKQRSQR